MPLGHSVKLAAVAALLLGTVSPAVTQDYEPPVPGYDFPADEATLLRFRDTQNIGEMRRHAWHVFAGITQPAKTGGAIWETWFPAQVTFSTGPQPQGLGPTPRLFESPNQLRQMGPQAQAAGQSNLSFVMLNLDAHNFIRQNGLHLQSKLNELNTAFPAGTPLDKREIKPFPKTAIALKPIWQVVRGNGLTVFPVWDGQPTQPDAQGNPPNTWTRVVAIDPAREEIPETETVNVNWRGNPSFAARVIPINRFYRFRITAAEIARVRTVVGQNGADVGDYAVLVMMHMTTKEIPDWVWATFWWHDRPDDSQFGVDRPGLVTGAWRNYRMDVSYSMDLPREYDGTPNAAFNPYLENFSGGIGSNCMTCHRQSRWTANGNPGFTVTRGTPRPDDPMFRDALKLDFLWSMADRAQ